LIVRKEEEKDSPSNAEAHYAMTQKTAATLGSSWQAVGCSISSSVWATGVATTALKMSWNRSIDDFRVGEEKKKNKLGEATRP